jgi:archaellum component FlaC
MKNEERIIEIENEISQQSKNLEFQEHQILILEEKMFEADEEIKHLSKQVKKLSTTVAILMDNQNQHSQMLEKVFDQIIYLTEKDILGE